MRDEVHRLYPTCGFDKHVGYGMENHAPEDDRAARVARHAPEVVRAREKLGRADELEIFFESSPQLMLVCLFLLEVASVI